VWARSHARISFGDRLLASEDHPANDGDNVHFRVSEFIAPFYSLSASRQPTIPSDCSIFISVPVDDETHLLFFDFWDEIGSLHDISAYFSGLDPDDLITGEFTATNNWTQDRTAMAEGHFSGVTRSVLHEDVAAQVSMGHIVDRSLENLCSTDLAIVKTRDFLLELLDRFESGTAVDGGLDGYRREGNLPFSCTGPAGSDWRKLGFRGAVPA
jgi:hypothetical protein